MAYCSVSTSSPPLNPPAWLSDFGHDLKHRTVSALIPLLHPVGTHWFSQQPWKPFLLPSFLGIHDPDSPHLPSASPATSPHALSFINPFNTHVPPGSRPLSPNLFCSPTPRATQMTGPAPKKAVNLLECENPQIHSPAPRWPLCNKLNQWTVGEPQMPKAQPRQNRTCALHLHLHFSFFCVPFSANRIEQTVTTHRSWPNPWWPLWFLSLSLCQLITTFTWFYLLPQNSNSLFFL